jgi:hypothetical protein
LQNLKYLFQYSFGFIEGEPQNMTAQEFVRKYILHDSLIESVEVLSGGKTIVLMIDFAFWMQPGYNTANPETGTLKVTFDDVSECSIPENVKWNEISILDAVASGNTVKFSLMNDMTDACSELTICSNRILAEKLNRAETE